MNILYVTSEAAPFVKTGGLGDVAGSLPVTLKEKGVDARVILPLYRCIDQKYKDMMTYIDNIYINMGWRKQYCGVFEMVWRGTTYYFVDNEYYFNGTKPYDYIHLDCEKFIFFSKAVLSLLPTLGFRPDVINCNDWQTAPIPVFLDTFGDNPFYRGIKTVMTIHNLKFQGRWDLKKIKDAMAIGDYYFTGDKLEYYKDANLLKGGLCYANKITTVSETYAREITTSEFGEGLDGLLWARRNDTVGIVNGISDDWDPKTDTFIYKNYTSRSLAQKKVNKTELQKELNLPVDENKFMVGIVSRLTDQKGFDLIACAMERLCEGGYQVVILGTGDENYENMFRHFAWKYPDRVSANIFFSNELSHKIYAACDAFLMPSRFEPCGLSQLISMKYGTLPIVRETGGLKDTVVPYNEYTGEGTGFSFGAYNSDDMMHVVNYAMRTYYDNPDAWKQLVKNAMNQDFSWNVSADKYIALYSELSGVPAPEIKQETPDVTHDEQDKKITDDVVLKADNKDADNVTEKPAKKSAPKSKKVTKSTAQKPKKTDEKTAKTKETAKKSTEEDSLKPVNKTTEEKSQKPVKKTTEEKSLKPVNKATDENSLKTVKKATDEKLQKSVKKATDEKSQKSVKKATKK